MAGLTDNIQKGLLKLTKLQQKFLVPFILVILLLTMVAAMGIPKLELESDFAKMSPKGLPITDLNDWVNSEFNELGSVIVVVQLDDSSDSSRLPVDIRDPEIMRFLVRLEDNLAEDTTVQGIMSAGSIFKQMGSVPDSLEGIKEIFENIPGIDQAFNSDYSFTLVTVEADIGADSEKIDALNERIIEIIDASGVPGGVKVTITGDAPLGAAIFNFLIEDAYTTLIISMIFIFVLLLFMQRSFREAVFILLPLCFGLTWTAGFMGWAGIPITIATAGLSAMLLGLGVEYSIFVFSRYKEELPGKSVAEALEVAVSNVGASIASSGGTTVIGFAALSISIFPVLADLGKSLAIGIFMLLSSTIVVMPLVVLIGEKISSLVSKGEKVKVGKRKEFKPYRAYGKMLSKAPWMFLIFAIVVSAVMVVGMQRISNQEVDFETVLPEDLEAMQVFALMKDEFGDSSSSMIYVALDSSDVRDLRDPEILRYIDVLSNKLSQVDYFDSVGSISSFVKQANNGIIPNSITPIRSVFDSEYAKSYINDDYSVSVLRIQLQAEANDDQEEVLRQLREVVDTTEKPVGVETLVIGGLASFEEQNAVNGEDSSKTSVVALLGIIVFLFILTRSFKGTFLPLITVILGVIWTLGSIGILGIPFNSITTSVITMTIGIGIDFGLQLMLRFQYELKKFDKKRAMEETLTHILTPMVITVAAAVIGFRAMSLGNLSMMADLGTTMGVAMVVSMLAAVTGVAAVILLVQRKEHNVYKAKVKRA